MRQIQSRPDADFAVCSNPEFLREGSAIYDFMHPDRVLVGCDNERAQDLMERLFDPYDLAHALREIGFASPTVKAHLTSVYNKLGVDSRGAAIAVAAQKGWLSPP